MKNIKPSELICLAIHNLEVIESKPEKYKVNMSDWHKPMIAMIANSKCEVCLAGALIAITLHAPIDQHLTPIDFPKIKNLLYAINEFRMGRINRGLDCMGIQNNPIKNTCNIKRYEENPRKFKKQMLKLANKLQKNGL